MPQDIGPLPQLLHVGGAQGIQHLLPGLPVGGLGQHGQGKPQGYGRIDPVALPRQSQGGAGAAIVFQGSGQLRGIAQAGGLILVRLPGIQINIQVFIELLPLRVAAPQGFDGVLGQIRVLRQGDGIGAAGQRPASHFAPRAGETGDEQGHGCHSRHTCRNQCFQRLPSPLGSFPLHRPFHCGMGGMEGIVCPFIFIHHGHLSPFSA